MAIDELVAGYTERDETTARRRPWETPVLREIEVEGVTEGKSHQGSETDFFFPSQQGPS